MVLTMTNPKPRTELGTDYRSLFYAWNGPGPYMCFVCEDFVLAWWDEDQTTDRKLVIHHIDGNHDNNTPLNLAALHASCHTAHHRSRRPLVAKGSELPPEWKARIKEATAARRLEMAKNPELYAAWHSRVVAGIHAIDKTPMHCECGRGPFKGKHGLDIHRGRSCTATGNFTPKVRGELFTCGHCGAQSRGEHGVRLHDKIFCPVQHPDRVKRVAVRDTPCPHCGLMCASVGGGVEKHVKRWCKQVPKS